jgi:hypothetical protein
MCLRTGTTVATCHSEELRGVDGQFVVAAQMLTSFAPHKPASPGGNTTQIVNLLPGSVCMLHLKDDRRA